MALDVTANVSDKTFLTPTVYQISTDFMSTAADFQTAVCNKSNRVIAVEKEHHPATSTKLNKPLNSEKRLTKETRSFKALERGCTTS